MMLKTNQKDHFKRKMRETLLALLETLPGAMFVVDDAAKIMYANACAQALIGATQEDVCGKPLWRGAPQLVSNALYQAVQIATRTRKPGEVEYVSPVTRTWLHVQLIPTVGGLIIHVHQVSAATSRQKTVPQNESISMDDLDNLHAGIVFLTPEGIVLEVNEVLLVDTQIRREEVIGHPLAEIRVWSCSPTSQEQLHDAIARASRGETVRFEMAACLREGVEGHLDVEIIPHRDEDHHIDSLVFAGIDITARKRAEAELHALIDTIPQLVWTMRPDGYVDYHNQRWYDYTGQSPVEVEGEGWIQCLHPEDRQRVRSVQQHAIHQGGGVYETELRLRHGTSGESGEYRWFLARGMPVRDESGQILKWFGTSTDIDEQKRTERQLKESQEHLSLLNEMVPQLVWMARSDGRHEYVNQRWCDYTGLTLEGVQSDPGAYLQIIHPDDRESHQVHWQHVKETGDMFEHEERLRNTQTGEYRWFLTRAMPMRDESGQIVKWFGTCTDIGEQKRAEQQLKESRESWRVLAETVPQLVWTTQPDGSVAYWNQRWYDYTGSSPEQALGHEWSQFLHSDDAQHTLTVWHHALETGEPYEVGYRLKEGQTGKYRWFLARGMPVRDESGQIVKWFGTCTDIEEQKRAEQQLKESQESWRVLNETVPQLVWVARPDGRHEYVNQRWCDYFGFTLEDLQRDPWAYRQSIHPEDLESQNTYVQLALDTGTTFEHEQRLRNSQTGEYRWFLVRATPMRDESGQIVKAFGTCTDIEEQKRAEQQLKASRENWRMLAETVPQLVWVKGPDGCHEYVNQRWCDYTGLTLEHVQSGPQAEFQFIHPDDQAGNRASWQHAEETGEIFVHEERLRNGQTGEYRWFLVRSLPMRNESGQIVKWFGTCTDIEDQKRIEEALRQSQKRVNALMNSNIIGIILCEGEQIVDANETFLRMTGYTHEEMQKGHMNWIDMTPPEYLARTQQANQELVDQQSMAPYEKEYICKDGSCLPVLVGGVLLPHSPLQHIAFVLDNSARKELEQRKDDFISMASHELRNPLTALKLQTTLLHRQLAKQGTLDQVPALARIENQIKTSTRLVEELLDVSKIQVGKLEYVQEMVDLDALVRESVETMQHAHPSHRILVRGAVEVSLIGDRDRLGQVFTNLLSNAIKYSPGAETVEMDLFASEETVVIRVQDHGLGIPREQRDKIFERFYRVTGSRRRAIPGLGMGLYIVAEIVKHHGGTITVESDVGKGSTFTVLLPKKRTA